MHNIVFGDWPIMPLLLCCSPHKFYLLCSISLCVRFVLRIDCFIKVYLGIVTVLLEYINL